MIDLRKYGYRSRRAFHADRDVPIVLLEEMAFDPDWKVQKSVITHPDCPSRIKDMFVCDGEWYKRFVVFFTGKDGYRWREALRDPDRRVRECAVRWYETKTIVGRVRRFLRENRIRERRNETRRLQQG
jgi:hypothetical protein